MWQLIKQRKPSYVSVLIREHELSKETERSEKAWWGKRTVSLVRADRIHPNDLTS